MSDSAAASVQAPAKRIPVAYDVDIVVAGAGISGSMAAIAAARHGAKTLVVDRFGQIGGNMGPGMWGGGTLHLALINSSDPDDEELLNRMGMGGIAHEFHRRVIFERPDAGEITDEIRAELEAKHYNVTGYRMGGGGPKLPSYFVDSQVCSHVLLEMMDEAGVETLLSAYIGDPILEGKKVTGLFVETKSGRLAIKAKIVIDATGQADVAFRAGAPVKNVSNPNLGTWFAFGNVDFEKYEQFKAAAPQASDQDIDWSRRALAMEETEADPFPNLHHILPFIRKAWESGEFEFIRRVNGCVVAVNMHAGQCGPGIVDGRTGTRGTIDFSDARNVTLMEREHREQVYKYARFLRKYVPGFEESYLLIMAPYLNARGGRYMDGVRAVDNDDLMAERTFDDAVYIYTDRRSQKNCDVPYGSFVARDVDSLMACGRSSHVYGPNFRGRCWALQNGQLVGIAAAMCVADGVQPRDLDYRKLQKRLVELGCPVGEEERLKELGLK